MFVLVEHASRSFISQIYVLFMSHAVEFFKSAPNHATYGYLRFGQLCVVSFIEFLTFSKKINNGWICFLFC